MFQPQVPLGVLFKSERNNADMLDILKVVHNYVPMVQHTTHEIVNIDDTEDEAIVVQQQVHPVLFGGDQMTVERSRNIQNVLSTSDTASARLQGIVPVAEDWHAKMCLYKVHSTWLSHRVTLYVIAVQLHTNMKICYLMCKFGCAD